MKELINNDIWNWISDYIEVNHEFYDNKFSLCPFARKARLKGDVSVTSWKSGSYKQFIKNQLSLNSTTVKVLVFPPNFRFAWMTRFYIKNLNKELVTNDMYIQCGNAVNTNSRYPGLKGNYSVVIINKLSDVLSAHRSLLSTNYYAKWTPQHYHNVVTVRQQIKDSYEKIN